MKFYTLCLFCLVGLVSSAPNLENELNAREANALAYGINYCIRPGLPCYDDRSCCSGRCVRSRQQFAWIRPPGRCMTVSTTRSTTPSTTRSTTRSTTTSSIVVAPTLVPTTTSARTTPTTVYCPDITTAVTRTSTSVGTARGQTFTATVVYTTVQTIAQPCVPPPPTTAPPPPPTTMPPACTRSRVATYSYSVTEQYLGSTTLRPTFYQYDLPCEPSTSCKIKTVYTAISAYDKNGVFIDFTTAYTVCPSCPEVTTDTRYTYSEYVSSGTTYYVDQYVPTTYTTDKCAAYTWTTSQTARPTTTTTSCEPSYVTTLVPTYNEIATRDTTSTITASITRVYTYRPPCASPGPTTTYPSCPTGQTATLTQTSWTYSMYTRGTTTYYSDIYNTYTYTYQEYAPCLSSMNPPSTTSRPPSTTTTTSQSTIPTTPYTSDTCTPSYITTLVSTNYEITTRDATYTYPGSVTRIYTSDPPCLTHPHPSSPPPLTSTTSNTLLTCGTFTFTGETIIETVESRNGQPTFIWTLSAYTNTEYTCISKPYTPPPTTTPTQTMTTLCLPIPVTESVTRTELQYSGTRTFTSLYASTVTYYADPACAFSSV